VVTPILERVKNAGMDDAKKQLAGERLGGGWRVWGGDKE
jgi:hypothetical protein